MILYRYLIQNLQAMDNPHVALVAATNVILLCQDATEITLPEWFGSVGLLLGMTLSS